MCAAFLLRKPEGLLPARAGEVSRERPALLWHAAGRVRKSEAYRNHLRWPRRSQMGGCGLTPGDPQGENSQAVHRASAPARQPVSPVRSPSSFQLLPEAALSPRPQHCPPRPQRRPPGPIRISDSSRGWADVPGTVCSDGAQARPTGVGGHTVGVASVRGRWEVVGDPPLGCQVRHSWLTELVHCSSEHQQCT